MSIEDGDVLSTKAPLTKIPWYKTKKAYAGYVFGALAVVGSLMPKEQVPETATQILPETSEVDDMSEADGTSGVAVASKTQEPGSEATATTAKAATTTEATTTTEASTTTTEKVTTTSTTEKATTTSKAPTTTAVPEPATPATLTDEDMKTLYRILAVEKSPNLGRLSDDDLDRLGEGYCLVANKSEDTDQWPIEMLGTWLKFDADASSLFDDDLEKFASVGGYALTAFCPDEFDRLFDN